VQAPGVQLAWARDRDGAKVHAARLDARDRRARAPFTCLGCGEELVPHLGEVRARHFAHRPGSSCPLTSPETALHLDAKERLLALCEAALSGARKVTLLARCPRCRRPAPVDVAALGDAAVEEGAIGPLRADVLVLERGRPALAIEVKVTHALGASKVDALLGAGVAAVEVDAREDWEREEPDGVAVACARSVGLPPCPACGTAARADEDRSRGGEAAEVAELEGYRARGLFGRVEIAAGGLASLAARFRCPECGGSGLDVGDRVARHGCPGRGARPVAWLGYDGAVVALSSALRRE
jgi:hypothetical protein